jgi:hypothetical protein
MRAVQIDRHGGPDVLALREVAAPEPAAGEVLIRTAASSLNPVDRKTRAWQVGPPLPATLGWDISGRPRHQRPGLLHLVPWQATFAPSRRPARSPEPFGQGGPPLAAPAEDPSTSSTRASGRHSPKLFEQGAPPEHAPNAAP